MRRLCLLLLLLPLSTYSQIEAYEGFRIEDREIIWQTVVDTTISFEVVKEYYQTQPGFRNVSYTDKSLLADVSDFAIDYTKYGKKSMSLPIITHGYTFSGKLRVDFKEDRYRLTFFGVYMTPIVQAPLLTPGTMTFQLLKNNRQSIRQSCATENIMGLFDKYFLDYLKVKATYVDDDF
jgi:hypothetical protein